MTRQRLLADFLCAPKRTYGEFQQRNNWCVGKTVCTTLPGRTARQICRELLGCWRGTGSRIWLLNRERLGENRVPTSHSFEVLGVSDLWQGEAFFEKIVRPSSVFSDGGREQPTGQVAHQKAKKRAAVRSVFAEFRALEVFHNRQGWSWIGARIPVERCIGQYGSAWRKVRN
jgi:hypothetical protein